MTNLFTIQNLGNLLVLLFLQAVLGFDNLLYISLESKRAPAESQSSVRRNAILIAVALRIVLLFLVVNLIERFEAPFFSVRWTGVLEGEFNFSAIVFLFGGGFIMYTAVREIAHMMSLEDLATDVEERGSKSVAAVVGTIVMMNLIFSFDSILSALAITEVFAVLALAIVGSGLAMFALADQVSDFLASNRKYEVLGLFILLIVGVVLLGEGGHVSHLALFGYHVEPLSKTTFYFSIVVLVIVDIVQGRYRRKLAKKRALQAASSGAPA